MALDPLLLAQALRTPPDRDVTDSPIVRVIILNDPANARDLVAALEREDTLEGANARRILCEFEPTAVPHLLAGLVTAGPRARKEGLEVLWALLTGQRSFTIRDQLGAATGELDVLLGDVAPLPDTQPAAVERDFTGRICDLAFVVVSMLLDPTLDQSTFRSLDEVGRGDAIRRLQARGYGRPSA